MGTSKHAGKEDGGTNDAFIIPVYFVALKMIFDCEEYLF